MTQPPTGRRERKDCRICRRQFRGRNDENTCLDCRQKGEGPALAPGCWTWRRTSAIRTVHACWDWNRPARKPGDTITVHKGPGKASEAVISEFLGLTNTSNGRTRIECAVKPDWE